ncbi:MAG TPA: cation-translocating P-type ATPase [Candidatus Dormibacteraeota bacterium]|nr:cation-translocating P-type ATPase [Candidatus Dormibacteraeota bacterium]
MHEPASDIARGEQSNTLGLSSAEAGERLRSDGPNELPASERRTLLRIAVEVFKEPMLALLVGSGVVYLILGDLVEALILLAFALTSVVITLVQEARTERVLEALRDLSSPRALVIRDGAPQRIAGREVVRGDVIVLAEGDRVPADATLLGSHDLAVDESLLTGESVAVRKSIHGASTADRRPGGDDLPYVFSGTLIVRGSGLGEVTATGARSEIGKIGQSLKQVEVEPPRLRAQTRRLVWISGLAGAAISVFAVVLYGTLRGGWLPAILAGIALGMSMLPEELPVVLTVFMAMGAWRISRARVLTRRATAIETLGSATVLCTDKTGTLTQNQMSVAELKPYAGTDQSLIRWSVLASMPEPTDPMEQAFHRLAANGSSTGWQLVHTYGLRPELLVMSQVWRDPDGALVVASKGAPEAIAKLCSLGGTLEARMQHDVDAMAERGLRVLGVASGRLAREEWPESELQLSLNFEGLVGLADPIRPGVPAAVAECRAAGVRVLMITGDYPATARAIATQVGLDASEVITGDQIEGCSEERLSVIVRGSTVFARIMPSQKLRIVEALKHGSEIVGMIGDGVNDAPSLKAAHIGVAVGGRGTDVAREASSLVLLDDDFGSIVKAIRLGRRIFDNLRKAIGFIFAVHVPIAGVALVPLLFGTPIVFTPIHIAFLEMIIDPVCSLVFEAEPEETNVMRRPPRPPAEPLVPRSLILRSFIQGLSALVVVIGVYALSIARSTPENELRAITYFAVIVVIVVLVLANRTLGASLIDAIRRPNSALALVLLAVTAVLTLSILLPAARSLFGFGPLHADDLTLVALAGAVVLLADFGTRHLLRTD